ncbi:hypothetical protein EK21DRAFT_93947 [Setomelanomma holmii]|uniref:Uncharacterized protein n=1 Tax=Setomelanomma holmii TaxID=210430 RepID=A0A9P4LHK0_9PLEO|nr:hypothetical protein EK21DRAFT_93947 [Setomelanomma holmii]
METKDARIRTLENSIRDANDLWEKLQKEQSYKTCEQEEIIRDLLEHLLRSGTDVPRSMINRLKRVCPNVLKECTLPTVIFAQGIPPTPESTFTDDLGRMRKTPQSGTPTSRYPGNITPALGRNSGGISQDNADPFASFWLHENISFKAVFIEYMLTERAFILACFSQYCGLQHLNILLGARLFVQAPSMRTDYYPDPSYARGGFNPYRSTSPQYAPASPGISSPRFGVTPSNTPPAHGAPFISTSSGYSPTSRGISSPRLGRIPPLVPLVFGSRYHFHGYDDLVDDNVGESSDPSSRDNASRSTSCSSSGTSHPSTTPPYTPALPNYRPQTPVYGPKPPSYTPTSPIYSP